jgi:hypothetical protein
MFYRVTAHNSDSVHMSLAMSFTHADDINLIIAKTSSISIQLFQNSSLKEVLSIPINGRIQNILSVGSKLYVSIEKQKYCVLEWDPLNETVKSTQQNTLKENGRICPLTFTITDNNFIATYTTIGLLKIIQSNSQYNVRLDKLDVIDMKLIQSKIAVLHQDFKNHKHLSLFTLNNAKKELQECTEIDVDEDVLFAIETLDGFILVGGLLKYYKFVNNQYKLIHTIPIDKPIHKYTKIDNSRYLLSSPTGSLYILGIWS